MVDQAQGDAIDPAQGTQVDHVLALIDAKGFGDMGAGRAQHRQQLFAGGIAALFQQVLAEARLGVKRVVDGAHQHQHTHALTALNPAALNQLVDSPAQGVAVNVEACRQLLLGGQIVAAAIVMAQLLLKSGGDFLIARGVTGRMSGQVHSHQASHSIGEELPRVVGRS